MKLEQGCARPQSGLTLLEMLIVLALIGIFLSAIVPSASDIIDKSRMTAQVNRMSSILQYTRYQAIEQNAPVVLCPSPDTSSCDINNWHLPKILFADTNFNQKRDPDEPLIHANNKLPKGLRMEGPKKLIRFYEDGSIGSPASILICPMRSNEKLNRALFVSLQGRVRLSKDSDGDEVHERGNGQSLRCK